MQATGSMSSFSLAMIASSAILAVLLLVAGPQPSAAQLGGPASAFLGQLGGVGGTNGSSPAAVSTCKQLISAMTVSLCTRATW